MRYRYRCLGKNAPSVLKLPESGEMTAEYLDTVAAVAKGVFNELSDLFRRRVVVGNICSGNDGFQCAVCDSCSKF